MHVFFLFICRSIAIENGTDDNVRQCNEFTDNINRAQLSITELKETMKQEEEEFDQFCANYEKEMEVINNGFVLFD